MSFIDLSNPSIKVKINEKTYELSIFGMHQWAQYCKYIQYKEYYDLAKDKKEGLPITEARLTEIYDACSKKVFQIDSPEISASLSEIDNISYVFYLAAKRYHPDIKYEELASSITLKNQIIVGKLLNDILALDTDNEDKEKNEQTPSLFAPATKESY